MRQLYPVLWVATLALGGVILLRPGGLGTLLALAANWENVPWSDRYTPPAPRSGPTPREPVGPVAPRVSPRPAGWPGTAADDESSVHDPRDGRTSRSPSRTDASGQSPPAPAEDDAPEERPPADEGPLPAPAERIPSTWPVVYPEGQLVRSGPTGDEQSPVPARYPETSEGAANPDLSAHYAFPNGTEAARPPINDRRAGWPSAGEGRDGSPLRPSGDSQPAADARLGGSSRVFDGRDRGPTADPFRAGDFRRPVGADVPQRPDATPCEGAEILGRVGSEVILAKELSFGIAELRAQNKEAPQDLLEAKIREILKQRVAQKIDERLVVQDAQRTIPKENFPKIRDNVAREFEASQVPRLMKAAGARTRQELENVLEASGSSLEMQKQSFIDGVLAHEWLRQQVKIDEDVGHEEMLDYYRDHISEFETPARARWEQLTVRLSRFASRDEAYAALAQMGNQVLDGAPLAEVAKAQSHGSTAQQGGAWDWTSQGSLASQVLDRAIFGDGARPGIPLGALSPILEEAQALHIIRVVERELPQRTPFEKAQVEIKKKIRAEREVKARQDYLAKLRRQTPVWTAFDVPATPSTPPSRLR